VFCHVISEPPMIIDRVLPHHCYPTPHGTSSVLNWLGRCTPNAHCNCCQGVHYQIITSNTNLLCIILSVFQWKWIGKCTLNQCFNHYFTIKWCVYWASAHHLKCFHVLFYVSEWWVVLRLAGQMNGARDQCHLDKLVVTILHSVLRFLVCIFS